MRVVDHEARRTELANAVLAVIARDGINSVSVRTVAAEAGWSRGVIAHYFSDRDELLLFAYRTALRRGGASSVAAESGDPLERLVGALLRMLPVDAQSRMDFQIWLGFMGRVADNPALASAVLHEHADLHASILSLVEQCAAAAAGRPGLACAPEPTYAETTESLIVFIDGLGIAAALDPSKYTATRLTRLVRRQLASMTGV